MNTPPRLSLLFLMLSLSATLHADELRIGTTLSLSGSYANYGRQALHGVELAVEEANARGGVSGKQVKLLVEDFGTLDLKRAVAAARKLIDVDKVEVLLPLIIEDSEVIVPITSRLPLFTMAVGCGARKCGFNLGTFHVRAPSSHDAIVERLATFVNTQNAKSVCIIAAESTYFDAYGRYIEELSKRAGQRVSYAAVPLSNTDDFREVAARFKSCDAIYSWIPMGALGSFFRRVREGGSKALLLGIVETDDPGVLQTAGPAAEGVVFARFSLGSKKFQEAFFQRFNEPPSRPALPSYDGTRLLLELIGKVGTAPQALRDAILLVQNHPAENGFFTYTAEGERLGEQVQLMRISGGRPVEID